MRLTIESRSGILPRTRPVLKIVRSVALVLAVVAVGAVAAAQDVIRLPPLELHAPPPTAPAAYERTPLPRYPAAAREQGLEGVVVLAVEVLASGRVGAVHVSASSGAPVLDEAAVEAVRRWTFTPARRGARAVDSIVEVPVQFSLARP